MPYVLLVAGVVFWFSVAFFGSSRKMRDDPEALQFLTSAPVEMLYGLGGTAFLFSAVLVVRTMSQLSSMEVPGPSMFFAIVLAVAAGVSLAGARHPRRAE